MSVTDYPTAFDEGFATHFQSLVRRHSRNPRLEELTLGLDAKPFLPYWLSNLDRAGRIDGVRRNLFVQQQFVPAGSDAEAWSRANESTAFDMARLKNGQQMLSSEGVIATLFHRWLVPGEASRDAIVSRYSQLFRTMATASARGWTMKSDTPMLLDLVDRYCADMEMTARETNQRRFQHEQGLIMIEYARWLGLRSIQGEVLQENRTMIEMCRALGFSVVTNPDDASLVTVSLMVSEA